MGTGKLMAHKQKGFGLQVIFLMMATVAIISVAAVQIWTSINAGNARSSLIDQSRGILDSSSRTLMAGANKTGSMPVSVAPTAWSGATPASAPSIGTALAVGLIPATSAAPKTDGWGSNLGYCTYTATTLTSPVFAIISAGADKVFQTTCTQAGTNAYSGDDGIRVKTANDVFVGIGSATFYFGDPAANLAALQALTSVRIGEIREVLDTGFVYTNPTGVANTGWVLNQNIPTVVSGASCATYPTGTFGKDAAGLPYTCQASVWTSSSGGGVPAGLYGFFNLAACPTGWIEANGANGTVDLRGEFIRGLDKGRGVDVGRGLSTAQSDQFQGHKHALNILTSAGAGADAWRLTYGYAGAAGAGYGLWYGFEGVQGPTTDGVNGAPRTGAETHPRNIAMLACMKQ